MKRALYAIPAAIVAAFAEIGFGTKGEDGKVAGGLKGKTVTTPEAETMTELYGLTENSDPNNVQRLAQGQLDVIRQRVIRGYFEEAATVEVAGQPSPAEKLLAEKGEEAAIAELLAGAQKAGDEYVYGAQRATTGAATVTRAKAAATDSVLASVDLGDEAKLRKMRALLGDAAVDGLIAAKKAQDEQVAAQAAKAAATPSA